MDLLSVKGSLTAVEIKSVQEFEKHVVISIDFEMLHSKLTSLKYDKKSKNTYA